MTLFLITTILHILTLMVNLNCQDKMITHDEKSEIGKNVAEGPQARHSGEIQTTSGFLLYCNFMRIPPRNYTPSLAIPAFLFFLLLVGCSKSDQVTAPGLDQVVVISVGLNYAVVSARIKNAGNADITARGFCWSKDPHPTLSDNSLTIPGSGDSFSDTIAALAYNTVYYVRAYATNSAGTSYSEQVELKTKNTQYTIGQILQGGKVFYIDSTGEHGLVYAQFYHYEHMPWAAWPYINERIGTTLPKAGEGKSNTQKILASGNNAPNTAAKYCDDFVHNGYSDWFLPSTNELYLVRAAATTFNEISGSLYWSSSEAGGLNVYLTPINAIASFGYDTKDHGWGVIPVRAF